MSNTKKHAGGRKHGRMARKPSHQRYNIEKRWETNKAKKQAKIKKRMEKIAAKKASQIEESS